VGIENVGFAVPINNYKIIKNDFNKNPIIYRPNLLFEYDNTDEKIIKVLTKGKINQGIIVSKIYKGSEIYNTNLKQGAIIYEIDDYKINNYGLSDKYWLGSQLDINILLNKFENNSVVKIKFYNPENEKLETINLKLVPYISPFATIYPIFQEVKYFILCGMIFMDFTGNQLEDKSKNNIELLCNLLENKDAEKPIVFISYIFPNGYINILNNLKASNFIKKVNNKEISSLEEFMKAVMKPIEINKCLFVKIEDKEGTSALISVEDIIKQDLIFSEIYKYSLNAFHKKFGKLIDK